MIAAATYPQPVANYDDAKIQTFTVKGIYTLNKQWSFTAGYTYEKYDYKDAQYDGYRYVIPAANRADGYNLGYLANPNYNNTIVYGMGDNTTTWWDNTSARHLGWRPQDSSEPFRAALEAAEPVLDRHDPAVLCQGGAFVRTGPFD